MTVFSESEVGSTFTQRLVDLLILDGVVRKQGCFFAMKRMVEDVVIGSSSSATLKIEGSNFWRKVLR